MQKIIFLGTDLHGDPSEHAAKLVRDITNKIDNYKIISIQNRKKFCFKKNTIIVPKIFENDFLRKSLQGILLPIYLLAMRPKYSRIFSFWTTSGKYHYFLFKFLRFLGYMTTFTVISGYNADYTSLKFCDKIVCQSKKMKDYLSKKFPNKGMQIIHPWTNLDMFGPKTKKNVILMPSIPYKIRNFRERGIDKMIDVLRKISIKTIIIFRSDESYNYFKKLNLKNALLINKILNDKELAKLMSSVKIIPLIYSKNAPDMPLSAIEGLASGCAIICTENLGLSEIIKKEKGGIIAESDKEIIDAMHKILKNPSYNKNARKVARKYFNINNNSKKYLEIFKYRF